jgi:hypothetical protein
MVMKLAKLPAKKGLNNKQKENLNKHPRPIVPIIRKREYISRIRMKRAMGGEQIERYDMIASSKIMGDLINKYTKLNENKYKSTLSQ